MKARKVIEKAPEKLRKRPKLGTYTENMPVMITVIVLYMIVFALGCEKMFGIFSKKAVFSEISKAGIAYKGYEQSNPKLYISLATIVTPL